MTDIMKLATDYAQACYHLANPDSYDAECAEEARAALQSAIEALQSKLGDAIQSSAYWQHQFTEAQAENEQFRLLAKANSEALGAALAERDALQSKLDAMGKGEPVQFLCDATRFKVRQHEGDEAGRIFGLPSELNGRWVALVAADDDCHLKLAAPKALAPLAIPADVLEAAVNMQTNHYRGPLAWAVKVIDFVADHGIGGTP